MHTPASRQPGASYAQRSPWHTKKGFRYARSSDDETLLGPLWPTDYNALWNVVWLTIINKLSTVILMWSSDSDVSEVSHFKDNGGYGQFRFLILSNAGTVSSHCQMSKRK